MNCLNLYREDRHFIVNVLEYVTANSTATRKKVGALIVRAGIIGQGFNSVARSYVDQTCEDSLTGLTKSTVMHAEAKAIASAANGGYSTRGTTLYCTIPPCPVCCGLIIEAGIKRVVFKENYWSENNLHLLTDAGIEVSQFKEQ